MKKDDDNNQFSLFPSQENGLTGCFIMIEVSVYSNRLLNFRKIFSLTEAFGLKLSDVSISSSAFFSSLLKVSGT